jgi:hypothetical protein
VPSWWNSARSSIASCSMMLHRSETGVIYGSLGCSFCDETWKQPSGMKGDYYFQRTKFRQDHPCRIWFLGLRGEHLRQRRPHPSGGGTFGSFRFTLDSLPSELCPNTKVKPTSVSTKPGPPRGPR